MVLTLVKQIQSFTKFTLQHWWELLAHKKIVIYILQVKDKTSWYNFCLRSLSKDFTEDDQSEISLNGNVYDFSVDHSSVKKEDILNIHKYLMIKNDIKWCLIFLKKLLLDY